MSTEVMETTNSVPEWIAKDYAELAAHSVEELRGMLHELASVTVANLARMAAIVRRMEEQGADLGFVRFGLLHWLRKVGAGQVLPEVVVRYQGQGRLLHRVASLPLPDQKRLSSDVPVEVLTQTEHGYESREVHPSKMTDDEVSQVLASDHIRSKAEQRGWLESPRSQGRSRQRTCHPNVVIDKRRQMIVVSGVKVQIPLRELIQYVDKLSNRAAK